MKSDAVISQIANQMIGEHGAEAEGAAIELANLMLELGERDRQVEWLRVHTAIVLLRARPIERSGAEMDYSAEHLVP